MADSLKLAVLGCGPAGLLAAHGFSRGAARNGLESEVRVYSAKRKSPLYGCQYLHRDIPGLDLRSQPVAYRLTGSISDYRRKVYGIEDVAVSPGILETDHTAWDIRQAYDRLWDQYEPAIEDYYLSPGSWRLLRARLEDEGFAVVSTVPAPVLCTDQGCTFTSETVWAMGDAPEVQRFARLPRQLPEGTILCSGQPNDEWYRVSHVFGHHTVEWPEQAAPPRGASRVTKPIRTTCACNPTVRRSGRYATWTKGILSHEAYEDGYRLANRLAPLAVS